MRRVFSMALVGVLAAGLAAAQMDPDVEKRIDSITVLVKDFKWDRAAFEAAELVAAHPHDFDAHMAAYQTNFEAYRYDPDNPAVAKFLDKALKHLNVARRVNPESYEAWEAAVSFWDPARLDPRPKGAEAEQFLTDAEGAFAAGDMDKAAELLLKVIEKDPAYGPAYQHLGEIYLNQKKMDEAIRYTTLGTEKDPRDPAGFLLLASIYGTMGRGEDAMSNLMKSLRADPGFPLSWQQLARLDLGGRHIRHSAYGFPRQVLWLIEKEVREPADKDMEGVPPVTRPAWKTYIETKVRWRQIEFPKRNPTFKIYRYTYPEESAAVTDMLVIWKEIKASTPGAADPLLDHWLAASQASALDAALLIDMYQEEWRQDYMAWRRANPTKFDEYFNKLVLPAAVSR